MNSNENQLDFDFINIIKSEEFLNSLQKLNNNLISQQNSNHLKTISESIDGLNENLKQYYDSFVLNSEEYFVCKYDDCEQTERQESEIIKHLKKHFNQQKAESMEVKPNISNIVFNDNNELLLPNNLLIDENVLDLKPNIKTGAESDRKDCALEDLKDLLDLELYIEKRVVDSKERFFCRWSDCRFESHQKNSVSRHLLNKHLNPKQANLFDQIESYNETKYWEKLMTSKQWLQKPNSNAKSAQSLPNLLPALPPMPPLTGPPNLTPFVESTFQPMGQILDEKQWLERLSSMANLSQVFGSQLNDKNFDTKNGFDDSLDEKERLKNHLNISNKEENILLSCKGLAAMSKVRQYYESQVIDGQKVFFCRWKQNGTVCQFQTRKSQKIAQHINLSHIGVEFKCPKPFCNKVFKNPNTYREHQKNHICGFGIFGYGSKGVIGACRNENLNRYRDRVVIEGKKFYRCIYIVNGSQCGAITRYHMAMKRHIHSHTCPHRKNLKLKQNQEVIHKMKSDTWNLDLGLGSMASTSSASLSPLSSPNTSNTATEVKSSPVATKKTYQCRRTNCTATFENTADLLKHENLLCKFVKNGLTQNLFNNKSVGKHMPTISSEELAASAATKQSVLQTNGIKVGNNLNANLSETNRRTGTADKYLSTKTMNGVDYHLCVYPKCKFTSKVLIKTIEHIQGQHLTATTMSVLEQQLNIESILSTNSTKRVRTSTESPETDSSKENSSKKIKSIEIVSNVSPSQVLDPTIPSVSGASEESYFNQINPYLNESHQTYACDLENCGKQFRNETALAQHKMNHICGFGIKGRKAIGVCDLDNIRNYREQMVVGDKILYLCKLCRKVSENRSQALICIHSHICPARLSAAPVDQQNSAFTESVVQKIIETNRKQKTNTNQGLKTTPNSIEIIEI